MKAPITMPAPPVVALPRPAPAVPARAVRGGYVRRFDVHERIQHVLMLASFTVLALTGLPQKFDSLPLSQWAIAAVGGLDAVRFIHHTAAWVMLFDCAYHVVYLAGRAVVERRLPLGAFATPRDFVDAWKTLLYFLGISKQKPAYDLFTYLEKFDYFAVFWGIAIIGGSGLVLLFPVAVTTIFPGYVVPVSFVAHSDEAVLAVGWILVVHMFYAHLAPHVFPFNTSIFTGLVRRDDAQREHPRWIARLTKDASKGG
ncbi:MAG: cytochrome b/b6 domain-containing protein [Chloroflexi bacterium]|nr:cytochrome b/b6 domain-containing protein [Chloroflexota bacterium]